MLLASYYLSRCGEREGDGSSKPPRALGVTKWTDAYDLFFDAMGDSRSIETFRGSIIQSRSTFDALFENGRPGWSDANGVHRPPMNEFKRIADEWESRTDDELEKFVLALRAGLSPEDQDQLYSPIARTEGGEKVYVSVRRERNPALRERAIEIHGLKCKGCGFNFGEFYGSIGAGFIEVHHIVPLSNTGERETNPETDLIVLCANCHRVVHRKKGVCLSLDELRNHIDRARQSRPATSDLRP